jgi:hypothetical protein
MYIVQKVENMIVIAFLFLFNGAACAPSVNSGYFPFISIYLLQ